MTDYRARSEWARGSRFNIDFELTHSRGKDQGYAAWGHMADFPNVPHNDLAPIHGSPEFTSYFRDQPLQARWGLRTPFQFQCHRLDIDPEWAAPQRW